MPNCITNEKKIVLPNGIRIVTEELPYVYSASIGFWVDTGSKNEDTTNQGISHFIEHMLFKGTKNRSAKDIVSLIEDTGGSINAFTDKENTCFFVRILDEYIPLAIEVLADILTNSLFLNEEIEKEKKVVIEEIKGYEDSPEELVFDLFLQKFWNNHPLGREILGTEESIKSINRDKIKDYLDKFYIPDNLVISIAGNFETDKVVNQISSLLKELDKHYPPPNEDKITLNPGVYIKYKDIEQIHICLGSKGLELKDERKYTLAIIDNILGGGMGSRLFQEVREKKGLVYTVSSYQSLYRLGGIFGVYAAFRPSNLEEVVKVIIDEFIKIKQGKISQEELNKSKQQIKGNLLLGMESVKTRMMRLARNELYYNRFIPIEEIINKIESVTLEDIQILADEILTKELLSLAIVGPISKLPFSYEEVIKSL